MTFSVMSVLFAATTNTVSRLITTHATSMTTASTTYYTPLGGHQTATLLTVENNAKTRQRKAGTLKNVGCYVATNRATTSTLKLRKNGADGNASVSITGGGASGWYEDTSSTDTVAAGEDWNYSITLGTGVDSLLIRNLTCDFVSTNGDGEVNNSNMAGIAVTDNTTRFSPISGNVVANATEANVTAEVREAFTFSNLEVLISANTVNATSTVTLRKNTVDTALVASITSTGTGLFEDTSNTVDFIATDEADYEITCPSVAGTQTMTIVGITMTTHLSVNVNITKSLATETVVSGENLARMVGVNRSLSTETVVSGESLNRMLSANRTLGDTTIIDESLNRIVGLGRSLSTESTLITEDLQRMLTAVRSLSTESNTIGENLARTYGANRPLTTESIVVGDSLNRLVAFNRILATETIEIGEILNRMLAANRALSTEDTTISEQLNRMLSANRLLDTQTTNISDDLQRVYSAVRTLSDTTIITDQLDRMLSAIRVLATETVVISDLLEKEFTSGGGGATNYHRILDTEIVAISESLQRMLAATRTLQDTTAITEQLARSYGATRTLSDSTSINEQLARVFDGTRTLLENTIVSESLNRLSALSRQITESTSLSDLLQSILGKTRQLIETVNISESLERAFTGTRTLTETKSISDSVKYVWTSIAAILAALVDTSETRKSDRIEGKRTRTFSRRYTGSFYRRRESGGRLEGSNNRD